MITIMNSFLEREREREREDLGGGGGGGGGKGDAFPSCLHTQGVGNHARTGNCTEQNTDFPP